MCQCAVGFNNNDWNKCLLYKEKGFENLLNTNFSLTYLYGPYDVYL